MLVRAAFKNSIVDKLTGRSTSAGPVVAGPNSTGVFRAYTGSQLAIDTGPSAYDVFPGASANWAAASGGIATLTGNINQNNSSGSPSGTLTFMKLWDSVGAVGLMDFSVGTSGSGAECILNSTTANDGSSGLSITNLSIKLVPSGSMKANETLLNALLDCFLNNGAAPNMGGSGTITVYDGTPPASASDAATGTALISFSTTTSTWNSASGGSASLVSSLNATASASGTATYARWTKGSYVLQGTIGTSGTTFLIDNTTIVSGNSFNLTGATITF